MDRERRHSPRVALDAAVRGRAAGSGGRGIPCRVEDPSASGVRLRSGAPIGEDWHRIEVLTASGRAHSRPLEARIVHAGVDEHGRTRIGCRFD